MTPEEVASLKAKSAALDEEGLGWVSPRMVEMMEYWKANRPKMYQEHEAAGTLVDLAQVAEMRFLDLHRQSVSWGLPEDDASREYADELLMTPESEDFPTNETEVEGWLDQIDE